MFEEMTYAKIYKFIQVDQNQILKKARKENLDVLSVSDFRLLGPHYQKIEQIMEKYRSTYANGSAIRGLSSGIGGLATSFMLTGLDTLSTAILLYRLSEQFAILNGFDNSDPEQKDQIIRIYLYSLGIDDETVNDLRKQILQTTAKASTSYATRRLLVKLIVNAARISGRRYISDSAGKLIPVAGGLIGAAGNYSFARKSSEKMKATYKDAYNEFWG